MRKPISTESRLRSSSFAPGAAGKDMHDYLQSRAVAYTFTDRSLWFRDSACTIPATGTETVIYIKPESGNGFGWEVNRADLSEKGLYCKG